MNAPQADKPIVPASGGPASLPPNAAGAPGAGRPPLEGAGDQSIDDVPMFKRKRILVPLLLLLVALAAGGWYWYVKNYSSAFTDDAYIDADKVSLSAKLLGRISFLKVDEGDTVKAGDTLVRLDDADLQAQLARAQDALRYTMRSLEVAAVNLDKAQDDYNRTAQQYQGDIVPREQYNHASEALRLAKAQNDMVQSQIATSQADCNIIRTQIDNSVIIAPFSGVVAKRWVLQGDVVQPGQTMLSIYDFSHLWVTANYEETKLRDIHLGSQASFTVDAYPGVELYGKVIMMGKSTASQFSLIPPSNASGNFTKVTQRVPIKISIESTPPTRVALVPGLSVLVRIKYQ
jgi:membrane fusion protein (multidrug efflux system)